MTQDPDTGLNATETTTAHTMFQALSLVNMLPAISLVRFFGQLPHLQNDPAELADYVLKFRVRVARQVDVLARILQLEEPEPE